MSPIGIRDKDGNIEAIAIIPEQSSEAQFGGFSENVPIRLQDIVCFSPLEKFSVFSDDSITGKTDRQISENQTFEETQTLLLTPKNPGMYLLLLYTNIVFIPTSPFNVTAIF